MRSGSKPVSSRQRLDVGRREPVPDIQGAVVGSPRYRHRRFAECEHATRHERGGEVREHLWKLVATEMRRDVEERDQVERRRGRLEVEHVAEATFQPPTPRVVDAEWVEVNAPGRPQAGQFLQVAAGAASDIQDAERPEAGDVRPEHRQADLPRSHVPPVGSLDCRHLVDFVRVHRVGSPFDASSARPGIMTRNPCGVAPGG